MYLQTLTSSIVHDDASEYRQPRSADCGGLRQLWRSSSRKGKGGGGVDAYQAHETTLHIEVARYANPFTLVGIVFLGGCGCAQVTSDGFCVPGIQETTSYLDVGYLGFTSATFKE